MMRAWSLLGLVGVLAFVGCGGKDSPTSPTVPAAPSRYSLSGTVTAEGGGSGLAGAILEVMDGADRGKLTHTAEGGRYVLVGLTPGTFTLEARLDGYETSAQRATLAADQTLNLALRRLLKANLLHEGDVRHNALPPDFQHWDVDGQAVNVGDGCAGAISGTLTLLDANRAEVAVVGVLPRGVSIVKPGESFTYRGCCLSTAQLDRAVVNQLAFDFQTVACP